MTHGTRSSGRAAAARRALLRAAAVVGLGVGTVAAGGAAAHADGIDVNVDGCGISITIGTPTTCPATGTPLLPDVPVVGDVTPVHVGVDLPTLTEPASPTQGTPPPAPAPAPSLTPLVTVPAPIGGVLAPITSNLPIPLATVQVQAPIIDCTVDAAAVAVGADCGVAATVPTGVVPPVLGGAVQAAVDDTSSLIDPLLAAAQTETGLGFQLAPTSRVEATTCTAVAVLTPLPATCPTAAATPAAPGSTVPAGGDDGSDVGSGVGGAGSTGAGGAGGGAATTGNGPSNLLRPSTAVGADDGTLPTTGLAIGTLVLIGAVAIAVGGLTRRTTRRADHGRT